MLDPVTVMEVNTGAFTVEVLELPPQPSPAIKKPNTTTSSALRIEVLHRKDLLHWLQEQESSQEWDRKSIILSRRFCWVKLWGRRVENCCCWTKETFSSVTKVTSSFNELHAFRSWLFLGCAGSRVCSQRLYCPYAPMHTVVVSRNNLVAKQH